MEPKPWIITLVREEAHDFTPEAWAKVTETLAEIDALADEMRATARVQIYGPAD